MHIVLFLLSIVVFGLAASLLAAAKSALHEIEAGIGFLISATLLSGALVCNAFVLYWGKLRKSLDRIESALARTPREEQPTTDDEQFRRWRAENK
jgi:hypothetical protein